MKGKGGGKFKYMSEKDMLELAAKFAPYRYGGPLSAFCQFGILEALSLTVDL